MSEILLRERIAAEAARLLLRGTERQFAPARRQAARWLSRVRLDPDDLPSDAEIQQKVHELAGLFEEESPLTADEDETFHPDLFPAVKILLERLAHVRLNSERHPEGDALYHTLQVFELGRDACPYDQEFLLACLLHDAGLAIDRRHPVEAVLMAIGDQTTARTRFLIAQHPVAVEFLLTGKAPRSLRKSEHFDDLLLLARCDRDGRVPGAEVCNVDEALAYLADLEAACDDVD